MNIDRLLEDSRKRQIIGEQLRGQIVRAENWSQLFPDPDDETTAFEEYLSSIKREYEKTGTLKKYRVEHNPLGDIHVFDKTFMDANTSVQKLVRNGNVILIFQGEGHPPHVDTICPDVGNIDHKFTKGMHVKVLGTANVAYLVLE